MIINCEGLYTKKKLYFKAKLNNWRYWFKAIKAFCGVRWRTKVNQMLSVRIILSLVFFYELCEIVQVRTTSSEYYDSILESLNLPKTSYLNVTTLDTVLKKLKLNNGSSTNTPGYSKVSQFPSNSYYYTVKQFLCL